MLWRASRQGTGCGWSCRTWTTACWTFCRCPTPRCVLEAQSPWLAAAQTCIYRCWLVQLSDNAECQTRSAPADQLVRSWQEGHLNHKHFLMQGLPLKALVAVVRQLLLGVSALHERGIIHRDIKVSWLCFCCPVVCSWGRQPRTTQSSWPWYASGQPHSAPQTEP